MKKHITVAALLIAGTAFANAEELTLGNSKGYAWLDGGDLKTSSTLSASGTVDSGISLSLSAGGEFFAPTTSRKMGTIVLTFDSTKLSTPGAVTPLATFTGNGQWGLGINASGSLIGMWTGGQHYEAGKIETYVTEGTVSVGITVDDRGTRIFIKDASTYWSKTELRGNFATGTLALSSTALSAMEGIGIWDITSYDDNAAMTSGMAAVAAIPEPATFGLFAGLGALCLVGTRRFRRNR